RAPHVVLDRLLSCEVNARDERRGGAALELSHPPPRPTPGHFDFTFQPSLRRRPGGGLGARGLIKGRPPPPVPGPPGAGEDPPGGGPGGAGHRAGLQLRLLPAGGAAARDTQGRSGQRPGVATQEVLQRLLLSLARKLALNSRGVLREPLTHLLIGPSPFKG